eukprot:scaffold9677_cov119-Skeletonema_marinoi.AAC.1
MENNNTRKGVRGVHYPIMQSADNGLFFFTNEASFTAFAVVVQVAILDRATVNNGEFGYWGPTLHFQLIIALCHTAMVQ